MNPTNNREAGEWLMKEEKGEKEVMTAHLHGGAAVRAVGTFGRQKERLLSFLLLLV
jgi:hypothetical protein